MPRASAGDEHEAEEAADEAVEHDRLGEREAQPHDPLQLAAQLGLPGDRLDHRGEDGADADAGAERAESHADAEAERLGGLDDVSCSDDEMEHWSSLVSGLDRRADVDGGEGSEDERLDGDDDDELEGVERDPDRERDRNGDVEGDSAEDEDQSDRDEDQ